MALIPKYAIKVSKDGLSLRIKDVTGAYSLSIPGGYGAPNDELTDVTLTTLQITTPSGGVYSLSGIASDIYEEVVISNVALGFSPSTALQDGVYGAEFVVATSFGIYSYTTEFFVTWNVECCFEKAQAKESVLSVKDCSCGCNDRSKVADYFYMAWSANKAFYCGKKETALAILSYLQTICQTLTCTTC
jgi:hypothetical protein